MNILERLAAGVLLIAALPVLVPIAIVILATDGRPVFFRQTRIGKGGRPFQIWKFRTMRRNQPGSRITAAGDSRVTRVGRFLRRYKLDELPQLWNVVAGDMALIGSRPEVPEFVDMTDPVWHAVLEYRPGITDLATITFRDEEDVLRSAADPERYYREEILPRKLALNLRYAETRSWRSDLALLWATLRYSLCPGDFDPARVAAQFFSESINESGFHPVQLAQHRRTGDR